MILLPRISKIEATGLRTYDRTREVSVEFHRGVTCLAGANGIGKSTFLALLIYGLTGAVPTPLRSFKDIVDYRKRTYQFTETFFDGRLVERGRDAARVRVEFNCGDLEVHVERGLLDPPSSCRLVTINGASRKGDAAQEWLEKRVVAAMNLRDFDQFIFIIHFLSVFDESRHLLFWDQQALEQILFVVFGGTAEASNAERVRRLMEREDSRVRNYQFEAKKVNDRIQILAEAQSVESSGLDSKALAKYEALQNRRDELIVLAEELGDRINAALIGVAEKAARVAALREHYSELFRDTLRGHGDPKQSPIILSINSDASPCAACGSEDLSTRKRARDNVLHDRCPLCDAPFKRMDFDDQFVELSSVDVDIEHAQSDLNEETSRRKRLEQERLDAQSELLDVNKLIARAERDHPDVRAAFESSHAMLPGQPVSGAIEALKVNLRQILNQKQSALYEREKYKRQLRSLGQQLARKYAVVEKQFVPLFQALATEFLGMSVAINFVASSSGKVALKLKVDGREREGGDELSESQRFFIDIALRMALTQFLTARTGAELYIDTPEGSLDIAYESRAGAMFARYVESGNDLVITANINTSALLKRLADVCRSRLMTIISMMAWSTLTEVQKAEAPAFRAALSDIEGRL